MKDRVLAFLVLLFPIASIADGFKVDMTLIETMNHFNVLNIGSLAVGEKGLVSIYGLQMCNDNGFLRISSVSELDSSPSEYSYALEITRSPNDTVSIVFSDKGKTPDEEAVEDALILVAASPECSELKKENTPLLTVSRFLGSNSVTAIISSTNVPAVKSENKNGAESGNSSTSSVLDKWIITESKSPIDDSPTVTLMTFADSGDTALVLRCKEDTTDAYIRTDEYLGDDSTSVTVRYDSDKAQKTQFSLSTDNKALFFSSAIGSIKKMLSSKKLVIRYHSYSGTPNTETFNVEGLGNKIKPLRTACHW